MVAEDVDEVVYGVEVAEHFVDFADTYVQEAALPDARGREDIELYVAEDVSVHRCQGDGEIDDGIDDGLHEEGGIARFAEDGAWCGETGDDWALNVFCGGLKEGYHGIVVGEEDGDLFG